MRVGADEPRLIGVVPAAGYATRLQPLEGSKEMLLIGGRPVMDHLIERLQLAGCTEIRVVTRPEKTDIVQHAEQLGLTVVPGRPASVSASLLAGLDATEPDDVVLFGFPDTIWEPADGFLRLLDALTEFQVALGVFRGREPERSDVVAFERSGLVTSVTVKPREPASDWIWGMAAARRRALGALAAHPEPGVAFDAMSSRREVVGVPLSGPFLDIGTIDALRAFDGSDVDQGG